MSARLNKKRKGRGTQINRERTVTTLTDGSEGSFMAAEDPQLSSPFSVASSSNGPTTTISPSFSMSSGFQYGYVPGTVIQSSVHGQSAQPAHFYSAQSLPPGRNDLEILERLKETIKNNQHELFTPVPRPSALASVYLGPHNGSQVPPHPEQIPRDYPSHHHDGRHARASSTASSSDARKVATGAGSSQTSNNMNLSSGLSLESIDSGNKSTDMDPPGLNTPLRSADSSQRTPRLEHAPVGTAGKYDARGFNRSGTEKSLGEVSPSKGDINIKEEPRNDRDTDWARRDAVLSQDAKASRYDRDSRYDSNGRPVGDARYGNNDNTRPSPRYSRGDYDRDKSRERDRDRDLDRNREHRRYEPNRFNDRRNDDRFRSTDNRRPPPDQRHYEPDYSSRNDASLGRWDSKSSVDSAPSPATRPLDARSSETRGPRSLAQERSFDSRDGRPPVEDRSYNERVSRPLAQERSFESRGPGPLSSERSFDQRGPRPLPADEDRSGKPPVNDDRRSYLPSSSDRTVRSGDNARGPAPASPSKPVIDDRRPVNTLPATRPLDDRKAPLSQPLSSSSVGADHRPPPPPLTADRQRPLDSGSDRAVKYPEDYPPRQRSVSVVRNARTSSPVRPPPPESDRSGPSRPQLPLEDRISRPTSLQDRLGSRPTDGPPPRQEVKGSHPAQPVEQRSSVSSHAPEPVNKPTVDPPLNGVQSNAPRNLGSDTSRPPPPATRDPPRPAAQTIPPARRSTGPPAQRLSYPGNAPVAPQAEEILKPRGTTPPRRAEYRPLDRSSYPDRYERDASREQRPDALDVTSSRFPERAAPQSYNRPSPPAYSRPEPRDWQPSREQHSYPRHSHDSAPAHATYEREWRGDERPPYDAAWEQRNRDRERTLEPGHEFGRDSRYYVGSWDPIRDRERYPPEEPPAARPYDNRLPPRDSQRYPESHTYERARYPESPPPVAAPRVRPRSPSPARRTGITDLQPPLKRARDDGYSASFYPPPPPPPSRDIPREYSAPASSVYYDDLPPSAGPVAPAGDRRDRSYRERDYLPPYDARHAPAYPRDDRRYG